MEFLKSLFNCNTKKVDFISELPLEVSQMILRKLDPESLLNVPQVSQKWHLACSSDVCLRKKARKYLEEKEEEDKKNEKNRMNNIRNHRRWGDFDCPVCMMVNIGIPFVRVYRLSLSRRRRRCPNARQLFGL